MASTPIPGRATGVARTSRQLPPALHDRLIADRRAARAAIREGRTDEAWRLLESTHILSQPWAWPHVRSHLDMLALAVRTRDAHEVLGQLLRIVVAGPGSATGKYPLGNTGRANVPATRPMPVPADLAELLALADRWTGSPIPDARPEGLERRMTPGSTSSQEH